MSERSVKCARVGIALLALLLLGGGGDIGRGEVADGDVGGSETGRAGVGGSETGRAETGGGGGAETGRAEAGGAEAGGAETGGADGRRGDASVEAGAPRPAPLDDAARRAELAKLAPAERFAWLERRGASELVEMGQAAARALGTYRATLTKQERIGGALQDPQTAALAVQPSPLALRLEFTAGSTKGRRLLYNAALRPDELRARESGLLGLAGGVWVGLDSSLTRRDTNHPVTDTGFVSLMELIDRDFTRAGGRHTRIDEGPDTDGLYCILFTAPDDVDGLYAASARLCIDPVLGLPLRTEISDQEGLLERYVYRDVEANLALPSDYFTPDGAGF